MGSFVVFPERVSKVVFQTHFGRKTHMLKLEMLLSHRLYFLFLFIASSLLFCWVGNETVLV